MSFIDKNKNNDSDSDINFSDLECLNYNKVSDPFNKNIESDSKLIELDRKKKEFLKITKLKSRSKSFSGNIEWVMTKNNQEKKYSGLNQDKDNKITNQSDKLDNQENEYSEYSFSKLDLNPSPNTRRFTISDDGDFTETEYIVPNKNNCDYLEAPNKDKLEQKIMENKCQSIRESYYTKLVLNIYLPTRRLPVIEFNSFFIFDWDDTFLPTNYLTDHDSYKKNDILVLSERDKKNFAILEEIILSILTFSVTRGNTYIITNAAKGWVLCIWYVLRRRKMGLLNAQTRLL